MNFIDLISNLHPIVIHFTVSGFSMSFLSTIALLFFKKYMNSNQSLSIEKFSIYNFWLGALSFPITVITGLVDSKSISQAVESDLLALKIIFGIMLFFMIFITSSFLFYYSFKKIDIFENNINFYQYIFMTLIIWVITIIIAGLGGLYVFGHSLFDNIGLGFILPTEIEQPTTSYFDTTLEAILFSPFVSFILVSIIGIIFYIYPKLDKT